MVGARDRMALERRPSGGAVSLQERLHARLEEGPIPFCRWMEACLYDPHDGYYMRRRAAPVTGPGPESDFATSPTLHPFFAHSVAREALRCWHDAGCPAAFRIAEYGGGRGDLARDALAWLAGHGWRPPWLHVEASPAHRDMQAGPGVEHAQALPDGFVGFVVAHEFLDALPVHLLERHGKGWMEMAVAAPAGEAALRPMAPHPEALAAAPDVEVPDGHRVAAHAGARRWFLEVGARMEAGAVLVVDYGDEGKRLWGRDPRWATVRTFRGQRDGGSPLEEPGSKDITASIDFAQCRAWAAQAGLREQRLETQEAFLLRHGVLEALNAIDRGTVEGASSYLRLRHMVIPHAGGMGRAFRVALYKG